MLINFDVMYKILSNQGPTSEKHLSTWLSLTTAVKLIKVKLIFKYFCSMEVIMSRKAASPELKVLGLQNGCIRFVSLWSGLNG